MITAGVLFALIVLAFAALAFFRYDSLDRIRPLVVSFGAGWLLSMIFLHMLPDVYRTLHIQGGAWVLIGFLIQALLEPMTGGLEHGHVHGSRSGFPWAPVIGLLIHATLEALPLFTGDDHGHGHSHGTDEVLATGILLHKLPITLVLVGLLIRSGVSKTGTAITLLVFALTMPLGGLLGIGLRDMGIASSGDVQAALNGLVVGVMLHISTTIVYEQDSGHRVHFKKFGGMLIGLLLGAWFMWP